MKGTLREIALRGLIEPLLTDRYGIGTGKVIDSEGAESSQTDLIVYGRDISPPIVYEESGFGLYPCEGVLAAIEVKSKLNATELKATLMKSATFLTPHLKFQSGQWNDQGTGVVSTGITEIYNVLFAFDSDLMKRSELDRYLEYADPSANRRLDLLCVVGRGCWADRRTGAGHKWEKLPEAASDFGEVLAFCAYLRDNLPHSYGRRGEPPMATYLGLAAVAS